MGDDSNVQFSPQNPYALFSPDQWSNQFSLFNNKALPWPSSYAGMPTDAMGNPIQPPQGMTLNSSPAASQPAAAAAPAASANGAFSPQQAMRMLNATGQWGLSGQGGNGRGPSNNQAALDSMAGLTAGYQPQQQQAAPAAATPGAAGGAPSYSQILSMLANPGPVRTPGATVPASASSSQPGPGGLQSFLANWRPASSGPGSQFQNNFAGALKGMGY